MLSLQALWKSYAKHIQIPDGKLQTSVKISRAVTVFRVSCGPYQRYDFSLSNLEAKWIENFSSTRLSQAEIPKLNARNILTKVGRKSANWRLVGIIGQAIIERLKVVFREICINE